MERRRRLPPRLHEHNLRIALSAAAAAAVGCGPGRGLPLCGDGGCDRLEVVPHLFAHQGAAGGASVREEVAWGEERIRNVTDRGGGVRDVRRDATMSERARVGEKQGERLLI